MTDSVTTDLKQLEGDIDDLVSLCKEFNQQYQTLQAHTQACNLRNQSLVETGTKTKKHLRSLINRLKTLETQHDV